MRFGAIRVIVLCGAAICSIVALLGHMKSGPFHLATAEAKEPAATHVDGQPQMPLEEATKDLKSLLFQASDTNPMPDKMFTWFTKCDLGLEPCTSSKPSVLLDEACASLSMSKPAGGAVVSAHTPVAPFQWKPSQAVIDAADAAFEPAKQGIGIAEHNSETNSQVPQQAFNSVLYDPKAACTIRQLGKSQAQVYTSLMSAAQSGNKPSLNFPDGATVVKLIWEVAPNVYTGKTITQIPAVETGNLVVANGKSQVLPTLPLGGGGALPPLFQWSTNNFVANISIQNANKPPCADSPKSYTFSPSCFTFIKIPPDMAARIVQWGEQGKIVFAPHASIQDMGYLVLTGINVMKFQSKTKQWLFSAFWWAQQRPHTALFAPSQWVHFSGCAVQQARTGGISEDNVCLSPYLEGLENPNGAYSNCANCHNAASFQAVSGLPSVASQSGLPLHTNYLSCKSLLDPKGNTPDCNSVPDGTGPAVDTHQLWSLADIPVPSTSAVAKTQSK
ncbi:hypothetical protein ACFPT7_22010 [Acidicapsa dinghuensis]|uniref:Uncharacterized protein n=1 Tax=Acidicapsa dinghuensis TaxID=2218256 RepID=A0ABW1ELW3_9BACT|nr:hypothetical protein [Acidicapsa dinghuensis]